MAGAFIGYNQIFGNAKPPKYGNAGPFLNESILRSLRVVDEQDAVNSGKWYGLPYGLTQNLIERILYYRGSGIFFYLEANEQFYFLPYVGQEIDVYGRYISASALPFNGSAQQGNGEKEDNIQPWIADKYWRCTYDIMPPEELKLSDLTDRCVILNDYSKQMSQKVLSRQFLNEPLLQVEAEMIPFLRTALLNSTGITGVRVSNQDDSYSVKQASNSVNKAAIVGDKFIPIESSLTTEPIATGGAGRAEEFLLAMQSLDNLRLSLHGVENGGLFQKKAHVLESEEQMNTAGTAGLVMQDKTYQRQEFCNIVNSIWGLGVWYEPGEVAMEADLDADGEVYDRQDEQSVGSNEPVQEEAEING